MVQRSRYSAKIIGQRAIIRMCIYKYPHDVSISQVIISPPGHIILIPSQPVFALSS